MNALFEYYCHSKLNYSLVGECLHYLLKLTNVSNASGDIIITLLFIDLTETKSQNDPDKGNKVKIIIEHKTIFI